MQRPFTVEVATVSRCCGQGSFQEGQLKAAAALTAVLFRFVCDKRLWPLWLLLRWVPLLWQQVLGTARGFDASALAAGSTQGHTAGVCVPSGTWPGGPLAIADMCENVGQCWAGLGAGPGSAWWCPTQAPGRAALPAGLQSPCLLPAGACGIY